MVLGLVWALLFIILFIFFYLFCLLSCLSSFLICHPQLGSFSFQCQSFLFFFRASDFPAELEIQVLIHPGPPHLSIGKHSVFISGKSGSYQSEKWLHLIMMNYWRISEGQRDDIATRKRCFLGLQYLRMRKLHWPTKSKYFSIFWFYQYVFGGGKKQLNSFVAVILSILCLTLFKTLALISEAIMSRLPVARGLACWSFHVAFVLCSAGAGLVRMRKGYKLLGWITKFLPVKVKTLFSVVNSE